MAEGQAGSPPRLVVPAYFHPALCPGQWEWLAHHPQQVRLVILNVANGPGIAPEPDFRRVLSQLEHAGVPVAGYVDTDYGRRPIRDVLGELNSYLDWYNVDGVCFDQVAGTAEHLRYYAKLSGRAREMGADVVMFNHGTHPLESYTEHADVLGTFEGPWLAYRRMSVPRWTTWHPAGTLYHVVHSVPAKRLDEAFKLALARNAGCAYVTDRSGANPYDGLPANYEP